MRGDGDGWALGADGQRYWGRHGAAGLLLRAPDRDGSPQVLLQHRAAWSHQGGTWALLGGARDSHETTVHAAVREAEEEGGIAGGVIAVRAERVTAGDPHTWTYTTVVADTAAPLSTTPNAESLELRWVAEHEVHGMPLHPAFAAAWPALRTVPVRLLIDTVSALGSWSGRALSGRDLVDLVAKSVPRTVELPNQRFGWVRDVLEWGPADSVSGAGNGAEEDAVDVVVTADETLADRLPGAALLLDPAVLPQWVA
ncbi:NUDIX hydrolase [Rhodococcus sp. D2-41]|uniref:NUDIX hydrolase n=1 Tax=Speluncibacter jeojiensis TaxID=2710754 RepID=A0A9X4RF38_9ACTN|nr:NUDIX hydrolase [Rhodococcus sp. D2-41]MDG3010058.1 NUDIX hydrolase [Rhodococcus sp. D2-41]MDG3016238.1 NUDIX hydrolase [Corynebacteriales bacterium D3-21]